MHTIRSFIAIPLAPAVGRQARRLLRQLRRDQDGIKWVPEDNLHLTLKFLGEVVDREVPDVCRAMRRVASGFEPFQIELGGTGGFPNDLRPRVLWAGISAGGEVLTALVAALEGELARLGYKPESRDYRPHLTLGRVRSGSRTASTEVVERLNSQRERQLGQMPVDRLLLQASFLDKGGPTYQVMDTVPLGQPTVPGPA